MQSKQVDNNAHALLTESITIPAAANRFNKAPYLAKPIGSRYLTEQVFHVSFAQLSEGLSKAIEYVEDGDLWIWKEKEVRVGGKRGCNAGCSK